MKQEKINSLLDDLVIKAASVEQYKTLPQQHKIIGALEMLVGTATRSGVEIFFNDEYSYLWNDALTGLEKVNAGTSADCYRDVLGKPADKKKPGLKKLQNALIITDFETIYSGVRKLLLHTKYKKD